MNGNTIRFTHVITKESQWNELCLFLVTAGEGKNWRTLGDKLGYPISKLDYFQFVAKKDPADEMLKDWQHKKAATMDVFLSALDNMDNYTVYNMVKKWTDEYTHNQNSKQTSNLDKNAQTTNSSTYIPKNWPMTVTEVEKIITESQYVPSNGNNQNDDPMKVEEQPEVEPDPQLLVPPPLEGNLSIVSDNNNASKFPVIMNSYGARDLGNLCEMEVCSDRLVFTAPGTAPTIIQRSDCVYAARYDPYCLKIRLSNQSTVYVQIHPNVHKDAWRLLEKFFGTMPASIIAEFGPEFVVYSDHITMEKIDITWEELKEVSFIENEQAFRFQTRDGRSLSVKPPRNRWSDVNQVLKKKIQQFPPANKRGAEFQELLVQEIKSEIHGVFVSSNKYYLLNGDKELFAVLLEHAKNSQFHEQNRARYVDLLAETLSIGDEETILKLTFFLAQQLGRLEHNSYLAQYIRAAIQHIWKTKISQERLAVLLTHQLVLCNHGPTKLGLLKCLGCGDFVVHFCLGHKELVQLLTDSDDQIRDYAMMLFKLQTYTPDQLNLLLWRVQQETNAETQSRAIWYLRNVDLRGLEKELGLQIVNILCSFVNNQQENHVVPLNSKDVLEHWYKHGTVETFFLVEEVMKLTSVLGNKLKSDILRNLHADQKNNPVLLQQILNLVFTQFSDQWKLVYWKEIWLAVPAVRDFLIDQSNKCTDPEWKQELKKLKFL